MIFNVKFITLASLFAVVVSQTPPQCVLDCSQGALSSATNKSCTSYADPCVCTDTGFQAADGACLQANCTAADQAAAMQLQQTFCGGSNTTASGSGSATPSMSMSGSMSESMSMSGSMTSMSGTPSSSGGSASGASSAATPSRSSAAGPQAEFGFFTLGVAAAGAVVGGMLL